MPTDEATRRIDDYDVEILSGLERIPSDLKEFFKIQAEHDKRIKRLEDKP